MVRWRWCPLFLCLWLWSSGLWAQPVVLLFKPFYWNPLIEGKVEVVPKGAPNQTLNLTNDLGVAKPSSVTDFDEYWAEAAGFELKLGADTYNLNFEGFQTVHWGNTVLSRSVIFGDSTFSAGAPLRTKLEYESLAAEFEYHLYTTGTVYLGSLVGVKVFRFHFAIQNLATGTVERETRTATLPYLGLSGALNLRLFSIFGRIQGLTSELEKNAFNADRYHYLEGSIGIQLQWGSFLAFGVEYRKLGLFFKKSDSAERSEIAVKVGGKSDKPQEALRFFIALSF